jgi:hypothetical protein
MRTRACFIIVTSLIVLGSCGGGNSGSTGTPPASASPVGQPPATPTISGNNVAVLAGAQIGAQLEANSVLSKSISVSQPSTDIKVVQATLSRDSSTANLFYSVIELTNVSAQILCQITFNTVTYQTVGTGGTPGTAFISAGSVQGSDGFLSNGTMVKGCLEPGQSAFYLDGFPRYTTFTFEDISSVKIESVDVTVADHIANTKVMPLSYSVTGAGTSPAAVNISVQNQSSGDIQLSSVGSHYVLLDSNNSPLTWGTFLTDPIVLSLTPGTSVQLPGSIYFAGSSSSILIYLAF